MVLKHMKKCSTLYITGYMQIKTTSKYHFSPITLATIQKPDNMLRLRILVRHSHREKFGTIYLTQHSSLTQHSHFPEYSLKINLH